jgi:hypothetical protein
VSAETNNPSHKELPFLAPLALNQSEPHSYEQRLNAHALHLLYWDGRHPRTEDEVSERIRHDDDFVSWCLCALHLRQTRTEQELEKSLTGNGVGFSKANAATLGRMAEKLLKGNILSPGDLEYCRDFLSNGRPRLAKYRRQLLQILKEQAAEAIPIPPPLIPEVLQ